MNKGISQNVQLLLWLQWCLLFSSSFCSFSASVFVHSFAQDDIFNSSRLVFVPLRATQSESTSPPPPPLAPPRWFSVLPPNCTWSAPYLSTGFKLAVGIFEHEHGGQGSVAVARYAHTDTHQLLVSVHLSFDNKNTSLKLSRRTQNQEEGERDYVTCAVGSVTDSNNNNANLFFSNEKYFTLHFDMGR